MKKADNTRLDRGPGCGDRDSHPLVVVGMSGGVDSSVAAYLLKKQGYDVVGVFMNHLGSDTADVLNVARALAIPCHIIDAAKEFNARVITRYNNEVAHGLVPNPCCFCNPEVKFKLLCDFADSVGADFMATGHYCRLQDGVLKKALDDTKDQSYFLCGLTQKQLSRVIFPLGNLTKVEVRKIAKDAGLVCAEKKDSNDICFKTAVSCFALGQRAGIGGQSQRMYIIGKSRDGKVRVGTNDSPELYSKSLIAKNFNWTSGAPPAQKFSCTAKTRYRQPDQKCIVEILKDGRVSVTFEDKQRAVTPGQWVVLYDGDVCLGGGEIQCTNYNVQCTINE